MRHSSPAGPATPGETEIADRVTLHPFGIEILRIIES
jgi:hypothetical protein